MTTYSRIPQDRETFSKLKINSDIQQNATQQIDTKQNGIEQNDIQQNGM